jgi:hypothetical protein
MEELHNISPIYRYISPFFGSGSRPSIIKTHAVGKLFLVSQYFSITLYSHVLICPVTRDSGEWQSNSNLSLVIPA